MRLNWDTTGYPHADETRLIATNSSGDSRVIVSDMTGGGGWSPYYSNSNQSLGLITGIAAAANAAGVTHDAEYLAGRRFDFTVTPRVTQAGVSGDFTFTGRCQSYTTPWTAAVWCDGELVWTSATQTSTPVANFVAPLGSILPPKSKSFVISMTISPRDAFNQCGIGLHEADADPVLGFDVTPRTAFTPMWDSLPKLGPVAASGGSSVTASATDAPTFSESVTRAQVLFRTATEAVSSSESATRTGSFTRAVTTAPVFSESPNRSVAFVRTATDAPIISESVTRQLILTRSVTAAPVFSESLARSGTFTRNTTDAPTSSDAATRAGTFLRTATDAPIFSDTVTRSATLTRSVTAAPVYSESVVRVVGPIRTATDAATIAGVVTRTGVFNRTSADAPIYSDAATAVIAGSTSQSAMFLWW